MIRVAGFAIALAVAAPAGAGFFEQFIDPHDGKPDASQYLSEHRFGFLPIPVIITEPAVGAGLGMMGLFFHESEQQKAQLTSGDADYQPTLPENISVAGGFATDNGTWGLGLGHLGFWQDDAIRFRGFVAYPSLNVDFYSIGGVELPRPVELNILGPVLLTEAKFRLDEGPWFIGLRQMYRRIETSLEHDDDLAQLPPPGTVGAVDYFTDSLLDTSTVTSGLGVVAEFDSTGNPFNPETGHNWSGELLWFDDVVGSDVNYRSSNLTGLDYWTLADKFLLGLRLQYDSVDTADSSRLPPYVPPFISLRGIPAGRYQGNDVVLAEAALDYRLNFRWKVGVFAGIGRAAQSFGALEDARSITSKGVGFRYLIARRYGFVMGADVARGPEETAFYIQAGSTW